jgi:predicted transcriptional regulator
MSNIKVFKIKGKTHLSANTAIGILSQEIMSTDDVSKLLGVSTRMVRLYIEQGIKTPTGTLKLKAQLITNRMYVINEKDLEKFKKMRDSLKS